MSPLVFLLVVCAGCLAVVARGRLGRFEQVGVALFVVVVACVAVGGLLSSSLRSDAIADGRALIPCIIGPLLALSWRTELAERTGGAVVGGIATVLLLAGLGSHAAVLVPWRLAPVVVVGALVLAVIAAMTAAATSLRRARALPTPLWRHRVLTEAAGVGVVGLGALLAAAGAWWPLPVAHAWPAVVALGAALATSARASAWPLVGRDLALGVGGALAVVVVSTPGTAAVVGAVAVLTGVVLGQGLLGGATRRSRPVDDARPAAAAPPPGLFGVAPILDDDDLRRPARPRVLARTSARRIIDAAIDRAWRGAANARGRAPIDVVGGDDIDVDGDAGELAEALCVIVDGALRARADGSDGRITVTLRAAPSTVSIELDDVTLPVDAHPFFEVVDAGSGEGAERRAPGAGLARARLLVERHGGQVHVRSGGRGAVHVTLPRRVVRGPVGIA